MRTYLPSRAQEIAELVRNQCENYVSVSGSRTFGHDLSCMCAVASATLFLEYRKAGIQAKFVLGEFDGMDHCWVETDDLIVDITATQFHINDKVYVIPVGVKSDNDLYVTHKLATTWGEIVSLVGDWGDQKPTFKMAISIMRAKETGFAA